MKAGQGAAITRPAPFPKPRHTRQDQRFEIAAD